jgi:hypothetical protein
MTHNYKSKEEIQARIDELQKGLDEYLAKPKKKQIAKAFVLTSKVKIRLLKEELEKMA